MKEIDDLKSTLKTRVIESLLELNDCNDFNVIKNFLINDIEVECPGQSNALKAYLESNTKYTSEQIENLIVHSTYAKWPSFFKNKSHLNSPKFVQVNKLTLKRLYYCDDPNKVQRKYVEELACCCSHHLKRCLECNESGGNALFHCMRFACCCCCLSYMWRLVCYRCTKTSVLDRYDKDSDNLGNQLACACFILTHILCCPCFMCYTCDRSNFKSQVISQIVPSKTDVQGLSLHTVTLQPTKFHFNKKYYKSSVYVAIEATAELTNETFLFWIKLPFHFNLEVEDQRDPDLY